MRGFLTMLPICSMEVPSPCATRPPQPFSAKLMTAKPTIWAQHPAVAAPPARPVSPSVKQMAAELMGSVSTMPTSTETRMPIQKGSSSVARMISAPKPSIIRLTPGPMSVPMPSPASMVTVGVTRISILVSWLTALPSSAATITEKKAPSGPPAA